MRSLWRDVMTAAFMGMILPGILLNGAVLFLNWKSPEPPGAERESMATEPSMPVRIQEADGTCNDGEMDAYLVQVVLAEMPASFEMEALKAQAVAARTYAGKAWVTGGKHADGSVCMESSCCQSHITEQDYLGRGGTQEGIEKIRNAVLATSGQILTYNGELIEATYFSNSAGTTEDAVAVWGVEYPYLKSVSSSEEEQSYRKEFTAEAFQKALGTVLSGTPESWFGTVTYTKGGGVDVLYLCGKPYSGKQLRELLGLKSTAFTVKTEGDTIWITTRGYGHRVGMSQYGADAMAAKGCTYQEILAHYYPGTDLCQWDPQ